MQYAIRNSLVSERPYSRSQTAFADYEFVIMKQELLVGFNKLTEDSDDPNEWNFDSHI